MWPSRHILYILSVLFSLSTIPIWKSGYRTRHFAPFGPAAAEYSWREKIIHSEIDWHTMNLRGGDAFSKYNVFFLPLYVNISLLWCRIMRFASFRLIGYIWSLYSHKKWKKEKIWLHAVPDSVALIKGMVSREIHTVYVILLYQVMVKIFDFPNSLVKKRSCGIGLTYIINTYTYFTSMFEKLVF